MTIRTLIVDDEDLARRGLRTLLRHAEDVEILPECRNGREAIEAITHSRPDLVFLDIQMPGKTGFEVLAEIDQDKCPYVIFVTAFDRFALQAFDVHALDYLLKPVNEERFNAAMSRAWLFLAACAMTRWCVGSCGWRRISTSPPPATSAYRPSIACR